MREINQQERIAYFGYGSLVNRATHRTDIIGYSKVTLKGWRREWLARPNNSFGNVVLLSVKRCENSEIDGLLVFDHARNQASLDERENNYDRHIVADSSITEHNSTISDLSASRTKQVTSIYVATPFPQPEEHQQYRILRSYLDAVMQGYLNKFGEEGVARFVNSTDNFDVGVYEDRNDPRYPRSVATTQKEQSLFDSLVPASN